MGYLLSLTRGLGGPMVSKNSVFSFLLMLFISYFVSSFHGPVVGFF